MRTSNAVIKERKIRVLEYLQASATRGDGALSVSYRKLAEEAGLTIGQARSVLCLLRRDGLVETQCRYLPNGGQLENFYRITAKGACALAERAAREEGAYSCPSGRVRPA